MDQPNFGEIARRADETARYSKAARSLQAAREGLSMMGLQAGKTAILLERYMNCLAVLKADGQTFDDPEIIQGRRRRILVK